LWLPVGGHIDKDEMPDEALLREIKEETDLDVKILNSSDIPLEGNVKKNLKIPFYVNVHSVGNHDHCTFFYVCKALNPESLQINKELKNFKWVSKDDLEQDFIPVDVKNIAKKAFDQFEKLSS
jgi:8-oxo-dGTP diphosphatase